MSFETLKLIPCRGKGGKWPIRIEWGHKIRKGTISKWNEQTKKL